MTQLGDLWTRWLQKKTDPALPPEEGEKALLGGNVTGKGLAVLALVGVALMMLSRGGGEPSQPTLGARPLSEASPPISLEESLARDLRGILGQIEGVGEVQVFVTLDAGVEVVIAEEVSVQRTAGTANDLHESRRPVTLRDDAARTEKPLVLVERKPTIRGVVVVADGASSSRVRYQLTRAVQTALSIPANRVAVFAMRSGYESRR